MLFIEVSITLENKVKKGKKQKVINVKPISDVKNRIAAVYDHKTTKVLDKVEKDFACGKFTLVISFFFYPSTFFFLIFIINSNKIFVRAQSFELSEVFSQFDFFFLFTVSVLFFFSN